MEGRWWVLIVFLAVPAALIVATLEFFSSNPISIFTLLVVMTAGFVYFLSYTDIPGTDSAVEPHW